MRIQEFRGPAVFPLGQMTRKEVDLGGSASPQQLYCAAAFAKHTPGSMGSQFPAGLKGPPSVQDLAESDSQ